MSLDSDQISAAMSNARHVCSELLLRLFILRSSCFVSMNCKCEARQLQFDKCEDQIARRCVMMSFEVSTLLGFAATIFFLVSKMLTSVSVSVSMLLRSLWAAAVLKLTTTARSSRWPNNSRKGRRSGHQWMYTYRLGLQGAAVGRMGTVSKVRGVRS